MTKLEFANFASGIGLAFSFTDVKDWLTIGVLATALILNLINIKNKK